MSSNSLLYSPICRNCWSGIKRYEGASCRICSEPFTSDAGDICGRCLMERPPFAGVITYGLYSDTLKEAINLLKFSSVKRLAKPLGMLIAKLDIPQVDMIVPVPLSIKRLRQRGFNQTLLIGRVVSKTLDIPLSSELLYKKKETLPQAVLSASDRARNLKNAFATRSRLKGETVLLVDDVMTTGATARECSKTLLKAGAGKVFVATVARAVML
jgi:ComF family protein